MTEENPIDATPEQPPETSPEAIGTDITSGTVPPSPEPVVIVPVTAPVIPQPIKETFFQKLEIDAEEAWNWLKAELEKL